MVAIERAECPSCGKHRVPDGRRGLVLTPYPNQREQIAGAEIRDEKVVWRLVMRNASATDLGKLAPHDLRRTCAKLCRKTGGDLDQIQIDVARSCLDPDYGAISRNRCRLALKPRKKFR
jgi:integrase